MPTTLIGPYMANEVVTDSGPLIHLAEIEGVETWEIFDNVRVPNVVVKEITSHSIGVSVLLEPERFIVSMTDDEIIRLAKNILKDHRLGANDAVVFGHALQLSASLLCTDDLELREAVKREGLRPVGTVGLLLRAFRKGIFDIDQLFERLDLVLLDSTLYITEDIIEEVKRSAIDFYQESKR